MKAIRTIKACTAITLVTWSSLSIAQTVTRVGERPIKRQEVSAFVGEQFAIADADKDGAITRAELQAFRTSLEARDQATFDEFASQAFDQADIDADGEIARWEVDQRATQLFDMVDVNRDGIASIDEQTAAAALSNLEASDVQDLLGQFK